MKSLTIKDLAITEELDGKSMRAVRGGWKMPYGFDMHKVINTENVSQENSFQALAEVGNNVANFGGHNTNNVTITQKGYNDYK